MAQSSEGASQRIVIAGGGVAGLTLAVALKQFRPDLEAYTREDVMSLLKAVWNGGKSGFDAVLRTRANSPKRGGNLSWVKE